MDRMVARVVGGLVVIGAVPFRLNPRVVLPKSYSWSGDFAASRWGMRVEAFGDLMNLLIFAGLLLILLSFTTLFDFPARQGETGTVPGSVTRHLPDNSRGNLVVNGTLLVPLFVGACMALVLSLILLLAWIE